MEIYTPDFVSLDPKYNLEQSITGDGTPKDFVAYHQWLKTRNRVLYVRDGSTTMLFRCGDKPQKIDRLMKADVVPFGTSAAYRVRTRLTNGEWYEWQDAGDVKTLPAGNEAQIEIKFHTDDGYLTPRLVRLAPDVDPPFDPPIWKRVVGLI